MTLDDDAIERLVAGGPGGGRLGLRVALRPLPPAGLSLHRQPRPSPVGRGGPDAARLRQGPGSPAALRGAGHPVRGLALPAGQEHGHRSRPDPPRPRGPGRRRRCMPATDAGPDEVTVARQELDEVAAALAALTDEQRDAIALRFFAGLSAREAADGDGQAGRDDPRAPVPGDRRVAATARIDEPESSGRRRPRAEAAGSLMDDAMIDLMAGECRTAATPRGVRRGAPHAGPRRDAARMRARVLAVAHRQRRPGRAVMPRWPSCRPMAASRSAPRGSARRPDPWRRGAAVLLAASPAGPRRRDDPRRPSRWCALRHPDLDRDPDVAVRPIGASDRRARAPGPRLRRPSSATGR